MRHIAFLLLIVALFPLTADDASAFRGRVARIAKIEQPHLELTLARDVHEPVYADAAARLLTAELS